jgi:glutamate N-acetyltransferase/amino-acid N-acetyltransferase
MAIEIPPAARPPQSQAPWTVLPPVERRPVIPAGFAAGGIPAGIKASGRPDIAVVVPTTGRASAAAVFTPNAFAAAPVRLSRAHLAGTAPDGDGRYGATAGIVSTSGCANAATGPEGDADQAAVARMLADALGADDDAILCLSTGLIGTRLPLDRVAAGIAELVPVGMAATDDGLLAAAEALRTTDSVTKVASTTADLPAPGGETARVRVTGIAKGVGMIHPRMATMLAIVLTDAAVEPAALSAILRPAVARTWDQLTVDGDTSTNDTVFLLASSASGSELVRAGSPAFAALGRAVEAVARDLARQQAADGEGATTLITCQAIGAVDDAEARAVARAVVASSLVKAAVHGRDPNWGRIVGAAGNAQLADAAVLEAAGMPADEAATRGGSRVSIDPAALRVRLAGHLVYDGGPLTFDRKAVRRAMDAPGLEIAIEVGNGPGTGEAFGCDLTEAYVRENSEYST